MPWVTRGGPVSLYGLSDAGSLWERGPDAPGSPGPQRWPKTMTLPTGVGGSGKPFKVRERFEAAFDTIQRMANPRTNPGCDRYFAGLGKAGLTLSTLLGWRFLFYRYGTADAAADATAMANAAKHVTGTETISVLPSAALVQIMMDAAELISATRLAATIVHELAHVAGAPGRPADADWAAMKPEKQAGYHAAENALKHCGFSEQHNPEIYGLINGRTGIAVPSRLT